MKKTLQLTVLALVMALVFLPVLAEDPPARPWSNSTEFGFISTSGNSKSSNFAFKNKFAYKWSNAEAIVELGALRTAAASMAAANVAGSLVIDDKEVTTAENYFVAMKYRRVISEELFWYAGFGWDKDRFAGVDSRWRVGAGLGYTFFKDDLHSLVGEVGLDYTDEKRIASAKEASITFAGARGFVAYERKVGASSKFEASLEVLENLKSTDDLRATAFAGLTATMTEHLALKASFTLKYDGDPVVKILSATGYDDVAYQLDEVDTILSASLVINF